MRRIKNRNRKTIRSAKKHYLSGIAEKPKKKRCLYPDFAQELSEERKECFCYARKFNNYKQKLVEKWIIEEQWSPE